MLALADQRRLETDHVAVVLGEGDQHVIVAQEQRSHKARQRALELVVQHADDRTKHRRQRLREVLELEPDHEALPAHLLDDPRMLLAQRFQPLQQIGAGLVGILDQALVVEDVHRLD